MENDFKLMADAFKSMDLLRNTSNSDVLYMTVEMCCKRLNRRLLMQNAAFFSFCRKFRKNGGYTKFYMTSNQFKNKLSGCIKIQTKNKSMIMRGYCDATNYYNKLMANKNYTWNERKNMAAALKRFNLYSGAVKINNIFLGKNNPITFNAIK